MAEVQALLSDPVAVEPSAPRSALRRFLFALGILTVLCLFCAPLYVDHIAADAPHVHLGQVSFSHFRSTDKTVSLEGDWLVIWRSPVVSGGPEGGDAALVKAPGVWEGARTASGRLLPRSGLATYRLTIHGLSPGAYTLWIPAISHASRVWVNDRLVSTMGVVGRTKATTRYLWRPHRIPIEADGSDINLAIDVAAFRHYTDGLDAAPVIGLATVMDARLAILSAQQVLFIVTLVILFFYGSVVFAFRSQDRASLYIALACLCLVPTAMVIGHENLLWLIFPGLSFPQHMAVEYLTCIFTFMLLLAYADALFPKESSRWLFWIFEVLFAGSVLALGAVLIRGDTFTASWLDRYPIFLAGLEMLYIVAMVFRATLRRRDGAAIFLLGMTVFTVSVLQAILVEYDIVPRNQLPGYDFAPMGILVFSFSHIIILAERWSEAMRSTEVMATDLRRLIDVSSSITSEIRLDALLRNVVEATSQFLHADRGTLFLHDARTGELRSMVAEGLEMREIRIPADSGIAGASFQTGDESVVRDAYGDPRFNRAIDEATGYRTRSILTLPIVTRDGRRLGVMQALNRRDGQPFEPADIDRMKAFAAHAAVAIDNATLFSDVVAARNYNDSILASMSGGVITLNAEGVVETINAAAGVILEVDPAIMRGRQAGTALSDENAWLLDEFEAVRADGVARALLDVDIRTAGGRYVSVNASIVPLINDEVSSGLLLLFEDISQEKRLKGVMRRFLTQRVVDQVLQRQDELLFGSACVASVLFADIRGFTSMAESLKARETVDMLNEVFTELVEAVAGADGVVDKFIGDAIMAVFGAPISSGRDALNAVDAANAMMRLVGELNLRRAARDEAPLRLGVGVATGELIAGAIGSPKRMEYTVIGDSVNLASRLQDLTKAYGVGVIVCEATARANASGQILRRLDTVGVRGRNRSEVIYQLLTYHDDLSFPNLAAVLAAYDLGLTRLEAGDWAAAAEAFGHALALNPADTPSRLMLDRARAALAEGRP